MQVASQMGIAVVIGLAVTGLYVAIYYFITSRLKAARARTQAERPPHVNRLTLPAMAAQKLTDDEQQAIANYMVVRHEDTKKQLAVRRMIDNALEPYERNERGA